MGRRDDVVDSVVDSPARLVPGGHLCWAYEGREDYLARAVEYLRDGVAEGQWIEYIGGTASVEALRAELAQFGDLDRACACGEVAVNTVGEFYAFEPETRSDPHKVVDPESSVVARMEATEQVVAQGYTGLRTVIDATAMVWTSRQRPAFAEFVHRIDALMSEFPITALCGYDIAELNVEAVTELACLHPLSNSAVPFRLYAETGLDAALTGTIDEGCGALFTRAISRAVALASGDEVVLDARGVDAIDQQRLRALNQVAGRRTATIVLAGASPRTLRLIESLDLPHVRTRPALTTDGNTE